MPWQNTLVCPSNFIKVRSLLTKPNKPDGSWWIRMVGSGNKIRPPSWKLFKSLEFVSKTSTASLCKPSRSRPPPAAKVQLVQQQRKQGQDDKNIYTHLISANLGGEDNSFQAKKICRQESGDKAKDCSYIFSIYIYKCMYACMHVCMFYCDSTSLYQPVVRYPILPSSSRSTSSN